jgi:hypothetical protein
MSIEEWLTIQLDRMADLAQKTNHPYAGLGLTILLFLIGGISFTILALPMLVQRWKKKRIEQPTPPARP